MLALDAGADDFNEEEDCFEVTTAPEDFDAVSEALTNEGITFASAEVTMIPQTVVELTTEDDIKKMRRILNLLDEEDDVQNVYHNWDEPEEDEEKDKNDNNCNVVLSDIARTAKIKSAVRAFFVEF